MGNDNLILLGHGSGGRLMRELIEKVFLRHFGMHAGLADSASISVDGSSLAYTTDSFVVDPLFFPGGNIGKLAVSGTVNDLSTCGAIPKFISCGFIIEEGFRIADLDKIVESMASEAKKAGVRIVTGDTKVVKRDQCDKLYINTSGIGYLPEDRKHICTGETIRPGDKIIVSGTLGDHAITILSEREGLTTGHQLESDVAPLNNLTEKILGQPENIRFMRDITRGGLATILAEICENKTFGIEIEEGRIPVRESVRSISELYGFDPLFLANEGKMLFIVKKETDEKILRQLHTEETGKDATIIGEVTEEHQGIAVLKSVIGGKRIIEMLGGEILPRIC